ncbi:MAG TPA: nucleotidyltransferase family protein [Dissulfurispiraceae bacterium]|nr:nucleotidyltransferase family protein [Dissulfurispiraceae bacterium]
MSVREKIASIVLSAGYSSRMSDFKPLLPLDSSTVIEKAISTFTDTGISDITVVLGNRADDLIPLLDRLRVRWVINEDYPQGMFSSVVAGIRSLKSGISGVFLLPADVPLVRSSTVEMMINAYESSEALVLYPVYLRQRGHPPLISSGLFPEILAWKGIDGLQKLLELHEKEAGEVEVRDEGILLDIDTPDDYKKICAILSRG